MFEFSVIKRPFFLSISKEKETVTLAMLDFYYSYKEKNHHFLFRKIQT